MFYMDLGNMLCGSTGLPSEMDSVLLPRQSTFFNRVSQVKRAVPTGVFIVLLKGS